MRAGLFVVSVALGVFGLASSAGCDSEAETGAKIFPHLSPVNFGDLYPLGNGEADPSTNERVPYEWVLLLQNGGAETLKIDKVCLIGDAHNGVANDHAFSIRTSGAVPISVVAGGEAAVEITYEHEDTNSVDADGDGTPDPDVVGLLIESNATNFRRLVVPVCARVVPNGQEKAGFMCPSTLDLGPNPSCP